MRLPNEKTKRANTCQLNTKAVFTTYRHAGLELANLPKGTYSLSIKINMLKYQNVSAVQPIVAAKEFAELQAGKYRVYQGDNKAFWLVVS